MDLDALISALPDASANGQQSTLSPEQLLAAAADAKRSGYANFTVPGANGKIQMTPQQAAGGVPPTFEQRASPNIDAIINALPDVSGGAPPSPERTPLTRQQFFARELAGALSPFGLGPDAMFGAKQALDAGAQMAARATGLGIPQTEAANKQSLQDYQRNFGEAPESDIGRAVGQGMATAPLLPMKVAGGLQLAKSALLGGAQGASSGALTPIYGAGDDFWQQKGNQVKQAAELGGMLGPAFNIGGRVLSPNVSDNVRTLLQSGVNPTVGQMGSRFLQAAEEKAMSLPILGDLIAHARGGAVEDFNRALYRNTLAPLGDEAAAYASKLPVGREGIAKAGDYISDAYNAALAKSVPAPIDATYTGLQSQLKAMLPQRLQQQFDEQLGSTINNRVTPGGTLPPNAAKEADSALGQSVRDYMGSSDPDQKTLGRAFRQAQSNLRDLVARYNPQTAPTIRAADSAWANLTQIEQAGQMLGAKEGVISPAQYLNAVRSGDNTVRNRAFARGEARNQGFAQAADQALSSKYPDSGTPGRIMFNALAAATGAGTSLAGWVNPAAWAGLGAAALPYLPGGRQVAAGLLGRRPEILEAIGDRIKQAAGVVAAPATAGLLGSSPALAQ